MQTYDAGGLWLRPKRQQSKNWLCFDEFLIWNVRQPNESVYWNLRRRPLSFLDFFVNYCRNHVG